MAETTEPSTKEKLKQELQSLSQALVSQFDAARTSTDAADLEALRILTEGNGTCRFKVGDWTGPISLTEVDQKTVLLQTFLLLLWQKGALKKEAYDPLGLKIARIPRKDLEQSGKSHGEDENTSDIAQEIETIAAKEELEEPVEEEIKDSTGETEIKNEQENETEPPVEEEEEKEFPWEVLLAEDGTNYLVGPREIDLQRKDHYHALFETYRRSTDMRKKNFLSSKHLLHVRKLYGLSVYGFGFKFCRQVLEKAAPSLEDLRSELYRVEELDLFKDLRFPRLQRLRLVMANHSNIQDDPDLSLSAPFADGAGLRWLHARLPRSTLESLLHHNAKTLLDVKIEVGTRSWHAPAFPMNCNNLEVMLADCGLGSGPLRRLKLLRGTGCAHRRDDCVAQLQAVRGVLRGVTVVCDRCSATDKSCDKEPPSGEWDSDY